MKPLSLYIHIPFCHKKCNYCDFLSFDDQLSKLPSYLDTLEAEIKHYGKLYQEREVANIFFGGGTPSLLSQEQLGALMKAIRSTYNLPEGVEITMECNPGTLDREKIYGYKTAGINRISMGLQASQTDTLERLGRIHTYDVFEENFSLLREAGFENINVDLMMGLPQQTLEEWEETLDRVLDLNPEHISAYGLSIEEGTPFGDAYGLGRLILPDEDSERMMYAITGEKLAARGYEHYEISNYAKPGFECRHNKVYWQRGDYLGLGLGASGFVDGVRTVNISDLDGYIQKLAAQDTIIVERQPVTEKAAMEEYCFLGLRLMEGISPNRFTEAFSREFDEIYGFVCKKLIAEGLLASVGEDNLRLTDHGIDVSNYVLAHFLID